MYLLLSELYRQQGNGEKFHREELHILYSSPDRYSGAPDKDNHMSFVLDENETEREDLWGSCLGNVKEREHL